MKPKIIRFLQLVMLVCILLSPFETKADLLNLLEQELKRELKELSKQETPPYFISYSVVHKQVYRAEASFGSVTGIYEFNRRYLSVMVRVGDYKLDNTHEIRDSLNFLSDRANKKSLLALDDNPDAIKTELWRKTNEEYRKAVERYSKVKANVAVKIEEEDKSADFSDKTDIENYYEPPADFNELLGDKAAWNEKIKKYTRIFLREKNIYSAQSSFDFRVIRKYTVTSEGTKTAHNHTYTELPVGSFIKSEDGMELPLYKSYFVFKPEGIPDDKTIIADIDDMVARLNELYNAPTVEPYTGPAMLSGRAASVFFHEIFGHRVEGHRLKKSEDAQTFKKKINEKVLPIHMSLIFAPRMKSYKGHDLLGHYKYDDEGVKAEKVRVVENGILKRFLMSRSPIENFPKSNGHGRAQIGYSPVSRQSNLMATSASLLSIKDLRIKLIEECKNQGKDFGLFFDDVFGGYTVTSRWSPNAFNVIPALVYKIYVDGRPDELVRGVDLVGTPLLVFSNITEAGDDFGIFNGICGAESGGIPVSAISPALLVTQIEVQKKNKSQERPPVLPRPDTEPQNPDMDGGQ